MSFLNPCLQYYEKTQPAILWRAGAVIQAPFFQQLTSCKPQEIFSKKIDWNGFVQDIIIIIIITIIIMIMVVARARGTWKKGICMRIAIGRHSHGDPFITPTIIIVIICYFLTLYEPSWAKTPHILFNWIKCKIMSIVRAWSIWGMAGGWLVLTEPPCDESHQSHHMLRIVDCPPPSHSQY